MSPATLEKPNPKTKLKKFRLLKGGHHDTNANLIDKDGKRIPISIDITDSDGVVKKRPNPAINGGRGFEPGDVIETDKDLAVLLNGIGQKSKKFEEVGEDGVTVKPKAPVNVSKFLNRMDVMQLKAFADDEEIDLTGAVKKVDIVNRIVNATTG